MDNIILPKSWSEIELERYLEIVELDNEQSFFLKQLQLIAIITDTSPDDEIYQDMDIFELNNLIKSNKWVQYPPAPIFSKKIGDYSFKDLNKLTLGEFIDLENLFMENPLNNLNKICAVLYRLTKHDEWNNLIYEPYDNIDIELRSNYFLTVSIDKIYGVISEYANFKDNIVKNYASLFQINTGDADLTDEEKNEPEIIEEIEQEKNHAKFAWFRIVHNLSGGDITKTDLIYDKPIFEILNQLSIRKLFRIE